jgi:protein involved in polysaccharide export with SLBB domain
MPSSFASIRLTLLSAAFVAVGSVSAASAPEERVVVVVGQGRVTEVRYSDGLTASKAIIAAGGYSDYARTPIYLIRCARSTRLDMDAVIRGEREQDTLLQPWDIIAIGSRVVQHR